MDKTEKYVEIYSFNVLDELEKRTEIIVVDIRSQMIDCVDNLTVPEFFDILKFLKNEKDNSIHFYKLETTEEAKDE